LPATASAIIADDDSFKVQGEPFANALRCDGRLLRQQTIARAIPIGTILMTASLDKKSCHSRPSGKAARGMTVRVFILSKQTHINGTAYLRMNVLWRAIEGATR
jgi:hypothetical protein